MASEVQIQQLREAIDEPTEDRYSSDTLNTLIDTLGTVEAVAERVWATKAAGYAGLVDVSEAGASHHLSDLHKHAMEMAKFYGEKARVPSSLGNARVYNIARA